MRNISKLDRVLMEVDNVMRTLFIPEQRCSQRVYPAASLNDASMTQREKKHVAGLMRVNHAGEVCAQALYQGQALTAQLTNIRDQMAHAAAEEIDHLAWCEQRLRELDSHPSILNPCWYLGSFMIGLIAGSAGDRWSLGFVAETERQVTAHLANHVQRLPRQDKKTRVVLESMHEDEAQHAKLAEQSGAASLPYLVKKIMSCISNVMTKSSYYV
ncbi:MAG: 2-polyprenyl-3-methyl-6-methoxy-1,4-benzoquinone monooxygenase [Legionella sp.]